MLFALHRNERADFSGKSIVNGFETTVSVATKNKRGDAYGFASCQSHLNVKGV